MKKFFTLFVGFLLVNGVFSQDCYRPYVEPALQVSATINKSSFNVDALFGISIKSPRIVFLAGLKSYGTEDKMEEVLEKNEAGVSTGRKFFIFTPGEEKLKVVGSVAYRLWIGDNEVFIPYVIAGNEYIEYGLRFNLRVGPDATLGFVANKSTNSLGFGINFFGSFFKE